MQDTCKPNSVQTHNWNKVLGRFGQTRVGAQRRIVDAGWVARRAGSSKKAALFLRLTAL
jgi:hypothetical protein